MATDRIEKIRKVMESDDESEAPDVDKIIKRLKTAQSEARRPVIGEGSLRERLEGKQEDVPDFDRMP